MERRAEILTTFSGACIYRGKICISKQSVGGDEEKHFHSAFFPLFFRRECDTRNNHEGEVITQTGKVFTHTPVPPKYPRLALIFMDRSKTEALASGVCLQL